MSIRGIISQIQRWSIHDGPGIRTTVFLKGCPLACTWCHNPELQDAAPEVMLYPDRCAVCGDCVAVCSSGALELEEGKLIFKRDYCSACGLCVMVCPRQAREMVGLIVSSADVVQEALRDLPFYSLSGGGITVSGGEPLAQARFAGSILRRAKQAGLHTALDTSGHAPQEFLAQVSEFADLILYDLKQMDPALHKDQTSVRNELILGNLKWLLERGVRVWVRVPFVQGLTGTMENIRAIARFLSDEPHPEWVELLPYHELALGKYRALERAYLLQHDAVPPKEALETAKAILEQSGLAVKLQDP